MRLVRRARKSIRERRMKACIRDLNANLEKVEMRVFRQQRRLRQQQDRVAGLRVVLPKDVLQGIMNPELYSIECRLHREAGLPPPAPYEGYVPEGLNCSKQRRIGFVEFTTITKAARAQV
ncbi:hypothetical protein ERJ75_000090700 [Trypanosoma vivax]|uniref:Uncharacterized protein n=1 Tax=Trypanosoma vivax (strain Y486) TaxID=1055687 RepID=G0U8N9_TRYVY|nr:hypothetical protein TRVL_06604 [Trypanosoma vivax]KAH8605165.1 hypothetical protein ERJ75_001671500 [Trypanosoma vivax]KAH8620182.1 hypothetical protein ERJ75_000090700 [Trypanosoma vivax]CCC53966.1 conserved hypothetical protein [Trypanosoma vivax Y486]